MKNIRDFFGGLFGDEQKPRLVGKPAAPVPRVASRQEPAECYRKGDVIGGKYEINSILGEGGFGVVYLVYLRQLEGCCAMKTFRDELLGNAAAREAFKREALLWVELEVHPFILAARWVEELSGRLFVLMEYVAPDIYGRVSLADHLARAGGPLGAVQTLKWAVQFCFGMEHAQAHGINCHRDIKPANILITEEGTLKITDLGLAAAAEAAWLKTNCRGGSLMTGGDEDGFGLSLMQTEGKALCGTPGYMAPEVYRGEGADIQSDIYSFGLVLWQMATGQTEPPFGVPHRGDLEDSLRQIYERQMTGRAPRVAGLISPVIERCLHPKPSERWRNFRELRRVLEPILERETGEKVEVPQLEEKTAGFWSSKGSSLSALGCHEEAINCFDRALALAPRDVAAWNNKGVALAALGRRTEAIRCYDQVLAIDPQAAGAWNNKGSELAALGRHQEALECYDKALKIDPRSAVTWANKGSELVALGRHQEALECYDKALTTDMRYASAWNSKGHALAVLGRREEAIACFDKVLTIDPRDTAAWNNKGLALADLGRHDEAMQCYDQALAIDPRATTVWYNKGNTLENLDRREEALRCYMSAYK